MVVIMYLLSILVFEQLEDDNRFLTVFTLFTTCSPMAPSKCPNKHKQ